MGVLKELIDRYYYSIILLKDLNDGRKNNRFLRPII